MQGWVIIRDTAQLVEAARALTTQLKWEARVIEVESSSEQRLLVCQKPITKRQSIWTRTSDIDTQVLSTFLKFYFCSKSHIIELWWLYGGRRKGVRRWYIYPAGGRKTAGEVSLSGFMSSHFTESRFIFYFWGLLFLKILNYLYTVKRIWSTFVKMMMFIK